MTKEQEQVFAEIRRAIGVGVKDFLAALSRDRPGETMYGFLLEVPCEGTAVEAVAGTEEGLTRVARRYAEDEGEEGEEATRRQRAALRWGSPEDCWYSNYEAGFFREAQELISMAHDERLLEEYDEKLNRLCLETLQELDAAGVFGAGEEREGMVIGLCYVGGDNSDKEFLAWAKEVNPASVIKRLRRELKEARAIQ